MHAVFQKLQRAGARLQREGETLRVISSRVDGEDFTAAQHAVIAHHDQLSRWFREHDYSSGPFALALGEQALLTLAALSGGDSGYNLRCALSLAADTDFALLERAVDALIARHELLRSAFHVGPDGCHRFVRRAAQRGLCVQEARDWSNERRDRWILERWSAPFDLLQDDPARFDVLRRSHSSELAPHVLSMVFHHVAVDYASIQLLVAELEAVYQSLRTSDAALRLGSPVDAHERVSRERAYLASEQAERDRAYWRQALPAPLPLLALPQPAQASSARVEFRGLELRRNIDGAGAHALRHFARARRHALCGRHGRVRHAARRRL